MWFCVEEDAYRGDVIQLLCDVIRYWLWEKQFIWHLKIYSSGLREKWFWMISYSSVWRHTTLIDIIRLLCDIIRLRLYEDKGWGCMISHNSIWCHTTPSDVIRLRLYKDKCWGYITQLWETSYYSKWCRTTLWQRW